MKSKKKLFYLKYFGIFLSPPATLSGVSLFHIRRS